MIERLEVAVCVGLCTEASARSLVCVCHHEAAVGVIMSGNARAYTITL